MVLVGALGKQYTQFQALFGSRINEDQMADQRTQFEITIISSSAFPAESDSTGTNALFSVGRNDFDIWKVIEPRHAKILPTLLDAYASGRYSYFPARVAQGFKEQNPIPGASAK